MGGLNLNDVNISNKFTFYICIIIYKCFIYLLFQSICKQKFELGQDQVFWLRYGLHTSRSESSLSHQITDVYSENHNAHSLSVYM